MFANYEENKINGHFVNIKADGTVLKGIYKSGQLNGTLRTIETKGYWTEQEYIDGRLH